MSRKGAFGGGRRSSAEASFKAVLLRTGLGSFPAWRCLRLVSNVPHSLPVPRTFWAAHQFASCLVRVACQLSLCGTGVWADLKWLVASRRSCFARAGHGLGRAAGIRLAGSLGVSLLRTPTDCDLICACCLCCWALAPIVAAGRKKRKLSRRKSRRRSSARAGPSSASALEGVPELRSRTAAVDSAAADLKVLALPRQGQGFKLE